MSSRSTVDTAPPRSHCQPPCRPFVVSRTSLLLCPLLHAASAPLLSPTASLSFCPVHVLATLSSHSHAHINWLVPFLFTLSLPDLLSLCSHPLSLPRLITSLLEFPIPFQTHSRRRDSSEPKFKPTPLQIMQPVIFSPPPKGRLPFPEHVIIDPFCRVVIMMMDRSHSYLRRQKFKPRLVLVYVVVLKTISNP